MTHDVTTTFTIVYSEDEGDHSSISSTNTITERQQKKYTQRSAVLYGQLHGRLVKVCIGNVINHGFDSSTD